MIRALLIISMICVGTLSLAQPHNNRIIVHDKIPIAQRVPYRTKDLLLLFKSCYETIYFLGNTKYKRTRKTLKEEEVSEQCFCICDKIREKYRPDEFLTKSTIDIHNIITPLAASCVKELGSFWENEPSHEDEE